MTDERRIGDEAVRRATGRGWEAWLAHLDAHGARNLDHKQIVALVAEAGLESRWWQQTVTVHYEKARSLRKLGETADADFQVGVQRTLRRPADEVWALLTSEEGVRAWLGEADLRLEPGTTWRADDGSFGEVRTVADGQRVRLTWQPPERVNPTTLQITVEGGPDKAVVRFHHERLTDGDEREAMRARWKAALGRLAKLAR